ncbi:MAG: AraC family ligand binding domain-containing protein [Apibacter sp.]|uniref:AraC family transcriptional regulator n=2 Tax=Apibacter TaxID=1778601 RepID=UPI0025F75221|nr:AraC family ligand binding domain-containing protein [Apibacter sp.]MCT6869945.1 AraC family ligand binding domain-containing protein [Apibacter sp.]
MLKFNQIDYLIINRLIENEYSCEMHKQDHYELIYIERGKGKHFYNDSIIEYSDGDLFVLSPNDRHYFKVDHETSFFYVKFTQEYFDLHKDLYINKENRAISFIELLNLEWLKQEKVSFQYPCDVLLKTTMNNLFLYSTERKVEQSIFVYYQIISVLGMIEEYLINRNLILSDNTIPIKNRISIYIQQNIFCKEKLSISAISYYFNISPNYFSSFFKEKFEVNYKTYVNMYLIKMIKKKLKNKDIKLKEIAQEFGFTDTSHLAKFLKKNNVN